MGNIVIGVLFIIGGMSGHFVLRGTNSPEALAVVGVILVIWGFIQVGSDSGSEEVETGIAESEGVKVPVSALDEPTEAIHFKAFDKTGHSYLGVIIDVDKVEKTATIKNDFGTPIDRPFDDLEIQDENKIFAIQDQAGALVAEAEMLSEVFNCPSCGAELELGETERINRYFTCPGCHRSFDFSKS